MQSIHGYPAKSKATTGRAIRILERVLSANGVSRARDLPEEARVRLHCQLALFFEEERTAHWSRQMNANPFRRAATWLRERLEGLRYTRIRS